DPDAVAALTEASWRGLADIEGILDGRRDQGFVRHCHGDLHLRNIFLNNGQAALFDAIEFNAEFADIDVLYDLAFLVMDLDHRNLRQLASIVLNRYLDDTGDVDGLATLPLFLSLRAAIRSHVQAIGASEQTDPEKAAKYIADAVHYLDLASGYLTTPSPQLIALGGLSGSGKSRLARELAPIIGGAPGARIVRTDCTRKRLAGVALGERLGSIGYSEEMNQKTYDAVYDECRRVLAAGRSVIADAVFADLREREAIERVASEAGVPFQGLWLVATPEVMEERVTWRRRNVSDATAWVVRLQMEYDLGPMQWQRFDTSGQREETVAQARELLNLA
ncbi:MAG: AAA family ATPase, partial [Rhodospirillales bacterium]|nr:AAA family ATPase [Rhodospirillales bacterium]